MRGVHLADPGAAGSGAIPPLGGTACESGPLLIVAHTPAGHPRRGLSSLGKRGCVDGDGPPALRSALPA